MARATTTIILANRANSYSSRLDTQPDEPINARQTDKRTGRLRDAPASGQRQTDRQVGRQTGWLVEAREPRVADRKVGPTKAANRDSRGQLVDWRRRRRRRRQEESLKRVAN